MIQSITGIIAAASAIEQIQKKDGTSTQKAVLHIQEVCNHQYPQEIAVTVTGDMAQFAGMVGCTVTVEYVVRVFAFTKNGNPALGNDVYARKIALAANSYYNNR